MAQVVVYLVVYLMNGLLGELMVVVVVAVMVAAVEVKLVGRGCCGGWSWWEVVRWWDVRPWGTTARPARPAA